MNFFDNESNILSFFRDNFTEEETVLFSYGSVLPELLQQITEKSNWLKWVNSSRKSDPPPDFFCDECALMMEVMRVDDHAYKNRKRKIVNPTNARESKMQKELQDNRFLERFPNLKATFCIPDTGLATDSNHNYTLYIENFIRTITEHRKKISLYRDNHPKCKLIFFVVDESSAYFQMVDPSLILEPRFSDSPMQGMFHQYWLDEQLIGVALNSDIDYLIWYTPWKLIQLQEGGIHPIPRTCVFDIKNMSINTLKYNSKLMMSSEA